jgi:hypothetical protein
MSKIEHFLRFKDGTIGNETAHPGTIDLKNRKTPYEAEEQG